MKKEPKVKLTRAQRELFKRLQKDPDSILRIHRTVTGGEAFRLLDHDLNPIRNYRTVVVENLYYKDVILRDHHGNYHLKLQTKFVS